MATINFLVQSKSDSAGIYIRLREGRLIDIKAKTNLIIDSEDWSHAKGQPKHLKEKYLKDLNAAMTTLKAKLVGHYNNTPNKLDVTTQWLKDFINPPQQVNEAPDKLLSYYDYYAAHKKNTIGNTTFKKLNVHKNLLIKFQRATKSEYRIKDVNASFRLALETYCLQENYAPNTISQLIKTIKTICYHAQSNGIEVHSQLADITIKWLKTDKIYLAPDELQKIEKASFNNERLNNAKDWLIISCETGQRVSDFMRFTKDQIRYEGGKPLIEFTQVKTNKIMTVPLSKKVMAILKKRYGNFPQPISDQKYNDYIKEVCQQAGLTQKVSGSITEVLEKNVKRKKHGVFEKWELVSSHIGRRSFATNNYGRIPTSLLIGATGHSTEKMFLEYIGKTDTQKALQLAEYF